MFLEWSPLKFRNIMSSYTSNTLVFHDLTHTITNRVLETMITFLLKYESTLLLPLLLYLCYWELLRVCGLRLSLSRVPDSALALVLSGSGWSWVYSLARAAFALLPSVSAPEWIPSICTPSSPDLVLQVHHFDFIKKNRKANPCLRIYFMLKEIGNLK